jgi:hypothetical protein
MILMCGVFKIGTVVEELCFKLLDYVLVFIELPMQTAVRLLELLNCHSIGLLSR